MIPHTKGVVNRLKGFEEEKFIYSDHLCVPTTRAAVACLLLRNASASDGEVYNNYKTDFLGGGRLSFYVAYTLNQCANAPPQSD